MKQILLLLILPCVVSSQPPKTLLLKYLCTTPQQVIDKTGKITNVGSLTFDAYFIKKENEYLFYKVPQFITQPDQLNFLEKAKLNGNEFSFDKDSIQNITYRNIDSSYNLVRVKTTNGYQVNKFPIWKGDQQWEVLPETKKIDRYNCQKAILKDDGDIVWEIWFNPEIPLEFGLYNLAELPGMVVEAKLSYPLTEFKLIELQSNIDMPSERIKPFLLSTPYKELTRESYENAKLRMRKLRRTNGVIQ